MSEPQPSVRTLFRRADSWREASFVAQVLRTETVGGALLLAGAAVALLWANSPWREGYTALRDTTVGPSALHLDLSLATWAADGLLAIFFFVVGLELKREVVDGELRDPRRAAVPILAAVGGMVAPAVVYTLVNLDTGGDALRGWAIPTATDIAFALAVLAVIGSHLPSGLRAFLLTLAVVDDLLAITIIAIFYTETLSLLPLAGALLVVAVFALLTRRRVTAWWVLVPLGVLAWVLMHESGIHATIAGVLLGFAVPAARRTDEEECLAGRFERRVRPLSAGFAVPVFAFMAAGVTVVGGAFVETLTDRVAIGVTLGLVLGKVVGVVGTTFLVSRLTRAELDDELTWTDLLGLGLLAGIGFTVSLLVGELAFGQGSDRDDHVKAAVLTGSLVSALLAAAVLSSRNRVYRRLHEAETLDEDRDGIPDVYQQGPRREAPGGRTP
ncbi:Na+/H+ antiporter NhaA [Angustibacter speluncae]